jgi:hypothetical protein
MSWSRVLRNVSCLAAKYYEQGIQTLVPRYDRRLIVGGAYVEK